VPSSLKLIVGLGNPGSEYSETRHNAGFWFLDRLAADYRASFSADRKYHGDTARLVADGIDYRLLKPQTYMNKSGRAVQAVSAYYNIRPEEILVVHDEIDLDTGVVRLKQGGGHGGHNGLRDIIEQIGSKDFVRLRLGVGHPGHSSQVHNYVLQRPGNEERRLLDTAMTDALAVMPLVMQGEMNKAMSRLHTINKPVVASKQPGQE
jgi:peptidyl-tRNA hydrolase, PTH1 family